MDASIIAKLKKINPYVINIYWNGLELILVTESGVTFVQEEFAEGSPTWLLFEEAKKLIEDDEEE